MAETTMTKKGQVVIPGSIRKSLGIAGGTKLLVMTDGENVLMKPIDPPRLESFEDLVAESREAARNAGLQQPDVETAIREARRARRG